MHPGAPDAGLQAIGPRGCVSGRSRITHAPWPSQAWKRGAIGKPFRGPPMANHSMLWSPESNGYPTKAKTVSFRSISSHRKVSTNMLNQPPSSERSREAELPGHEVPRRSPNSPIRRSPPVALLWHPQSHGLAANPTLATDRQPLLLPLFQSLATRVPTLESEAVTKKQSSPECQIVPRDFVKTTGAPLVRGLHRFAQILPVPVLLHDSSARICAICGWIQRLLRPGFPNHRSRITIHSGAGPFCCPRHLRRRHLTWTARGSRIGPT